MKILVTGGAGFIGSNLIRHLLQYSSHDIVCLDNFNRYYNPAFKERNIEPFLDNSHFKLIRGDITDKRAMHDLFEDEGIEKVCHLAAKAGVRASIENPTTYEEVNVRGTLNLLELSKEFKIRNFVYASSSSVYGNLETAPFREEHASGRPLSPYGATKAAAESLIHSYHHLYGFPCTVFRFFTVYGPNGRPDMAPYKFTQLIHEGQPLQQYGDGSSKRDYTHISDIVPALHTALNKNLAYEIINLGNDQPIQLSYFISIIEEKLGKKADIHKVPRPAADCKMTHADISKARRLLNYDPKTTIEEGMEQFIDWYLQNVHQTQVIFVTPPVVKPTKKSELGGRPIAELFNSEQRAEAVQVTLL
jgi:UDP-glucuronate 4-epimerase